eukprot:scaffold26317_cov101-Isochrysis_galbana.AAC.1
MARCSASRASTAATSPLNHREKGPAPASLSSARNAAALAASRGENRLSVALRRQPARALLQRADLGALGQPLQRGHRRHRRLREGDVVRQAVQVLGQKEERLGQHALLVPVLIRVGFRYLDEHSPVGRPLLGLLLGRLGQLREPAGLEQQRRHGDEDAQLGRQLVERPHALEAERCVTDVGQQPGCAKRDLDQRVHQLPQRRVHRLADCAEHLSPQPDAVDELPGIDLAVGLIARGWPIGGCRRRRAGRRPAGRRRTGPPRTMTAAPPAAAAPVTCCEPRGRRRAAAAPREQAGGGWRRRAGCSAARPPRPPPTRQQRDHPVQLPQCRVEHLGLPFHRLRQPLDEAQQVQQIRLDQQLVRPPVRQRVHALHPAARPLRARDRLFGTGRRLALDVRP